MSYISYQREMFVLLSWEFAQKQKNMLDVL